MKTVLIVVGVLFVLCICCACSFFALNMFIRNQELTDPEDRLFNDIPGITSVTPSRPTTAPEDLDY